MKPDNQIHRVENIHIDIPYQWILRRLGYEKNDHPDRHTLSLIEQNVAIAVSDSKCSGAFRVLKIKKIKKSEVELDFDLNIRSMAIAKFLSDCQYAGLIFATAGRKITAEIETDIHGDKMTEALIIDAAGSEIADAAVERIQSMLNAYIKKLGLRMKDARFSPGYSDFLLSNQKIFYELLDMASHEVRLTKTFQLIPEKSVTAICGLR